MAQYASAPRKTPLLTRIAILGATGQIGRDLAASLAADPELDIALFARRPEAAAAWRAGLPERRGLRMTVQAIEEFGRGRYDAIVNCVGVGDPARLAAMGAEIFEVTARHDQMALDYLQRASACRYLFLSSGAVYGGSFQEPAGDATIATVPINALAPQDWYAAAKLHAECRHRALADRAIWDLRIFSYFSRSQDLEARFLVSDMLRAIKTRATLATTGLAILRDFIHPQDFHALVQCLLQAPPGNVAVDCYSLAPVAKAELLAAMQARFGLKYEVSAAADPVNASGTKLNYYSTSRRAAQFGYRPTRTSLDGVLEEAAAILGR